jgi:hypothetical protein
MKMVVFMSILVVTVADMVPHAGPYLALVASAMAAWAFTASPKTAVGTIVYGIVMTVIYSPGFVLNDLARGKPQLREMPAGVAELTDSVGALATGTMPRLGDGAGGMGEITQLSVEVTVALVLCHIAALVIGIRRNIAAKAAEEDSGYVYH